MFNSLVNWLIDPIQEIVTLITTWLLQINTMTVSEFLEEFPAVAALYTILQTTAIGFIVLFAAWGFLKVIIGSQYGAESPLKTAGFAVLAAAMVYFGNNMLELVINLFSYPYSAMFAVDTISLDVSAAYSAVSDALWAGIGVLDSILGKGIIFAVVMLVLFWKLLKLIAEMLQRWMMLSVMVYTSPLAWALLASSSTRQMFTRWVNMFVSQCVVLLLNAWCVKIILSSMQSITRFSTIFSIFRYFILISCFIKIATSLDSYVAQIGLNPVQVGRSFWDDILATSKAIGRTLMNNSIVRAVGGSGTTTLGTSAQHSAAAAAAGNINARNQMPTYQRVGSAIAHPIKTAQSMAMETREAVAGNLYRNKSTGAPIKGSEAKNILAQQRKTGTIPNDVAAIYGNSSEVETGKAVAGNIMAANNVQTAKAGNMAILNGTRTDLANTLGKAGGYVDGTPYQEAFVNTAAHMKAEDLSDSMNESQNNAGKVADSMLGNAAGQTGIGTEIGNANLAQINRRAEMLGGDAGQEFLMQNTGSAVPLSQEQAHDVQQNLESKFGESANGENFRNMYSGHTPANSASGTAYTVADMTDVGRESALSAMQTETGAAIASAREDLNKAESLYKQAEVAESAKNHSQANRLTNEANRYQSSAMENIRSAHETLDNYSSAGVGEVTISNVASADSRAETMAALETVSQGNESFNGLKNDAAVPQTATWSDMTAASKETELDNFKSNFENEVKNGNSQQAVEKSIAVTGYATPKDLEVSDVQRSTAATATDTINNMVYGSEHTTVNFSGSSVKEGQGNGTMRYQTYAATTGQYYNAYDKVDVATSNVPTERRQNYIEHKVGNTKFYTRRTPIRMDTRNSTTAAPKNSGNAKKQTTKKDRKN